MKKIWLVISLIFFFLTSLNGQHQDPPKLSKHAIYGEVGIGLGGALISLNYEYLLIKNKSENLRLLGKAGIGFMGVQTDDEGGGVFGGVTVLTGKGENHFDLSLGGFLGYDRDVMNGSHWFVFPNVEIGYRFQERSKGMIIRFNIKPFFIGAGGGIGFNF